MVKNIWTDLVGTKKKGSKWYGKQVEMRVSDKGYRQYQSTGLIEGTEFRGYTDRIRNRRK